ncbi:MAG: SpoIVB peptidase [Eubacteriales bacterium]
MAIQNRKWKFLSVLLLSLTLLLPVCVGLTAAAAGEAQGLAPEPAVCAFAAAEEDGPSLPLLAGQKAFRFPGIFGVKPKKEVSGKLTAAPEQDRKIRKLSPGGMAFGVRLFADGVMVVGLTDDPACRPAQDAGMKVSDMILKIDGVPVKGVKDVIDAVENSNGRPLRFTCRRGGETVELEVTPRYHQLEGRYKAGIWVRDSAAGIGTVTFVDAKTGIFGGLGHGICDVDTGTLMPISRGAVMQVDISGIVRGEPGKPGELRGFLKGDKVGTLLTNSDCGVFGVLSPVPTLSESLPVAGKAEVSCGAAVLRCALDTEQITDYAVDITDVNPHAQGSKCFTLQVRDERLLAKTGGIVQGMSGSPIIQNGKLIGAVTHVLINDPTRGYGIFLENMLNALPESLTL